MGQQMTKEEDLVFSMWKALLKQKGMKYSDYGPRRMLIRSSTPEEKAVVTLFLNTLSMRGIKYNEYNLRL